MTSFASFSAASSCFALIALGREIDGATLFSHVERNRGEVVKLLERRREHMLARVLLHVIAASLAVDRAAYRQFRSQPLRITLNEMQHVAGLLVLRHLFHANARRAFRFQPAGVEDLSSAGGIERRPVQRHRERAALAADRHNASFELLEKGVGVVEALGQGTVTPLSRYRESAIKLNSCHRISVPESLRHWLVLVRQPKPLLRNPPAGVTFLPQISPVEIRRDMKTIPKTIPRLLVLAFVGLCAVTLIAKSGGAG